MLDAVNMPDDDQTSTLSVMSRFRPPVLVIDTVHAFDKFLDKRRMVVPANRRCKDEDIAGKYRIIYALHLVIRVFQGTLAGIGAVIRVIAEVTLTLVNPCNP